MNDLISTKRKNSLCLIREIDRAMEKQFYDEYKLLDEGKFPKELMFTVTEEKEEEEEDHMDLEENEQNWFNTQLE